MPIQRKPPTLESALNRLAALCAKSEYCPSDVRDKLLRQGFTPADADQIVDRLIADRFIDEERYVRAFIHDKVQYELWGHLKIRFALRAKRLPDDLIDRVLDESASEEQYLGNLETLLRRKLRTLPRPLSPTDRAKLYRFAAQRGYESDLIAPILRRLTDGEPDDTPDFDAPSDDFDS
jgi:regulatory protein